MKEIVKALRAKQKVLQKEFDRLEKAIQTLEATEDKPKAKRKYTKRAKPEAAPAKPAPKAPVKTGPRLPTPAKKVTPAPRPAPPKPAVDEDEEEV